ncbi:hypothetical protein ABE504_21775 [Paenibacillus oryzisoli]|uniref:hypothetical protein n=1 Tax=Paenibacillus oryzisoli TaxID=1850517 RepID=UPI003D2E5797
MKRIHKTWVAGMLAAGLLIGGGLLLQHNQAFADESASPGAPTSSPAVKKHGFPEGFKGNQEGRGFGDHRAPAFGKGGGIPGFGIGGDSNELATLLGMTQEELTAERKAGKSLAEIAQAKGVSEDTLVAKLTEAETKKLDDAVAAGKLKQEQADKMKTGIADRWKKLVEAKPGTVDGRKGPAPAFGKGGSMAGFGTWGDPHELATILGMTDEELAAERKAGKSLAEIAQAKGISEDELIAKLKDSMTAQLKSFVERKGGDKPTTPPQHGGKPFKAPRGHIGTPAGTAAPQAGA